MALVFGLTGGIATGKSTFANLFVQKTGAQFFDADACVHALLEKNAEVREAIGREIDPSAYSLDGRPDRARIRSVVFSDPAKKIALESILHPRVRASWMSEAQACRRDGRYFLADIPLLFETHAESHFDAVVVVACSEDVRLGRLTARPGISLPVAKKMIASQSPLGEKIAKSQHVVWNDGSLEALAAQADFLSTFFHVPTG